jgi:hypothetical protein
MAMSNLGAPILLNTAHRVLGGPYHRNIAGNLTALAAFLGVDAAAEAAVRRSGATLVAFCPGNDESRALAGFAPDGLAAALLSGKVPAWLEPVAAPENASLRLFRVRPGLAL